MARHIESKSGLKALLERMKGCQNESTAPLKDFKYWKLCVQGCIIEGLAMDETDYENAPAWFRPLWKGLK